MNGGVEQARAGDLAGAEKAMHRALKLDPDSSEAWLNLGHVHRRQKRSADAIAAFTKGLEVSKGELVHEHRFWQARTALLLSRASSPSHEQRLAQTREILEQLRLVVDAQPHRAVAWELVAQCHELLDEPSKADVAYRRAIEADPRLSSAFVSLGMLYLDYGHTNVAIAVLDVNVQVNDLDAGSWLGLGRGYMVAERYEQAIEALAKAAVLDPDRVEVYYALGMAHAELRHRAEAIENLERVIARSDGNTPADIRRVVNATIARMRDMP